MAPLAPSPSSDSVSPAEFQWEPLLREVSRSFYLTLRMLPGAVRPQIGLTYLLARATDTIADTRILPVDQRLEALQTLERRILSSDSTAVDFGGLARHQGTSGEEQLLAQIEAVLSVLAGFSSADQHRIREVLRLITSGQELDVRRFGDASRGRIAALATDAELDDYTYRVAGCVGEFWTRMCRAHLFPAARLDEAFLLKSGVQFGRGLQLVNILRDLPADLRQGRCYLPADRLLAAGLTPADLLDPSNEPRLRPLYDIYLDRAEANLAAGWEYTNALPRSSARVRLGCAWAILIGVRTLQGLRAGRVLEVGRRIKISRAEVRAVMLRSLLAYPLPSCWRGLFEACRSPEARK
jgi:farnesyl-diphosphate farnesyltransferase